MGAWNRLPILTKSVIVMALVYTGVKLIQPPLPSSLVSLYMSLAAITIWMYLSLYDDKMEEFMNPIKTFLRGWTGENFGVTAARFAVLIAIPLYVGTKVYAGLSPSVQPPIEQRVIHPAPPAEYMGLTNPVPRTEKNIRTGQGLYIAYCTPCHGVKADGRGPQYKGFDPPPANFVDVGTIAQLQESYLFWRIAKGGPGLPVEGMPWKSAMPRWETRISEENIWKIIMYEYQLSGHKPRTWE
ncbi:MAG TPA: cytochrome c [Nitrospiria bacterium]